MALIARWRFEPGALTTDSSGNGNTLALAGGVRDPAVVSSWRIEGQGSCYFDVTDYQYMSIADASLSAGFPLRGTDATPVTTFTFAFWFRAADTGTTRIIFRKGDGVTRNIHLTYQSTQKIF